MNGISEEPKHGIAVSERTNNKQIYANFVSLNTINIGEVFQTLRATHIRILLFTIPNLNRLPFLKLTEYSCNSQFTTSCQHEISGFNSMYKGCIQDLINLTLAFSRFEVSLLCTALLISSRMLEQTCCFLIISALCSKEWFAQTEHFAFLRFSSTGHCLVQYSVMNTLKRTAVKNADDTQSTVLSVTQEKT